MQYYIMLSSTDQSVNIYSETELEECLIRGCKQLFEGTKKECNEWYDDYCEEYGYTGSVWDKTIKDLQEFD